MSERFSDEVLRRVLDAYVSNAKQSDAGGIAAMRAVLEGQEPAGAEMSYETRLLAFAKQATHRLDDATMFCGLIDGGPFTLETATQAAFALQLGVSILQGKTIVVPVAYGVEVPPKFAAIADRIVRYDPDRPESLRENLAVVLTELGINPQ